MAPPNARMMTSWIFMARSRAAAASTIVTSLIDDGCSATPGKSGHFTCSRERTDHVLPTPPLCVACLPSGTPIPSSSRAITSVFQCPELRGLAGEAELSPACRDILVHGPTDLRPLRELLDVAVLHAGVDQRLGAVGPLVGRVLRRVEPGRPGVAQDVDILDGVAARGHRPD